jgi:hypothetical protein
MNSVVKHLSKHNEGALPWQATEADEVDHARALRNRVSASTSVRDVRGILSVTRDTAMAATSRQPARRRLRLVTGYLSGFLYRPPVLPADSPRR